MRDFETNVLIYLNFLAKHYLSKLLYLIRVVGFYVTLFSTIVRPSNVFHSHPDINNEHVNVGNCSCTYHGEHSRVKKVEERNTVALASTQPYRHDVC